MQKYNKICNNALFMRYLDHKNKLSHFLILPWIGFVPSHGQQSFFKTFIDKPQLKPKAKAKLKAKAWAEVVYIITPHPRPRPHPVPILQKIFKASTIRPIELKFLV